jgi:hypothetical protein
MVIGFLFGVAAVDVLKGIHGRSGFNDGLSSEYFVFYAVKEGIDYL